MNKDLFLDIDLVTAAYISLKGWPLPDYYKRFRPEEIEPMKEKVKRAMQGSWPGDMDSSPLEWEAADALKSFREKR